MSERDPRDTDTPARPFFPVDEVRERTPTVDELAEQPDTGGVIDETLDIDDDVAPDEDEPDIYDSAMTIRPPS